MPRSIWNGALSFGLVNVPIAVEPCRSRTIDIEGFVDLDEVDPIYFEKTYYMAPREEAGAERPYGLLRTAMERANKVAIGRFVMRTKQYLAAIRPSGDMLVLETMFFPDEVRSHNEIDEVRSHNEIENLPRKAKPAERELAMAEQLIESLSTSWDPARYRDTYRERVLDLIEQKAEGKEIVTEARPSEEGKVADLMAALEASLAAARGEPKPAATLESDADDHQHEELQEMSRDELYQQARRDDIPGRSKMTRQELVEALEAEAS